MTVKGLSVEERKADLLELAQNFSKHLLSPRPRGSVLTNLDCWHVANIAREAVFCKHNNELPIDVCFRPGSKDFIFWMDNKCKSTYNGTFSGEENADAKKEFLVKTIHAVVRHQHRLPVDEIWYKSRIEGIHSIFLSDKDPKPDVDEHVNIRCHQILCEILCISLTSHAIQTLYLGMSGTNDVVNLPSIEEVIDATNKNPFPPEPLDITSLCHEIQRDTEVSDWSPFFVCENINVESPEAQSMDPSFLAWLQKTTRTSVQPRICIYLAPYDAKELMNIMHSYYLQEKDRANLSTFDCKCDGITRYQLEVVAATYTRAVNCHF